MAKTARKSAKKAGRSARASQKGADAGGLPKGHLEGKPVELDGATKLVIVESPAKAKTINKYLGKDYKVVASMGHVRDLPRNRFGIDIEHDFEPRYVEIYRKRRHTRELRKAAKQVAEVYLCPDPDREGEAIAWHLIEALRIPPEHAHRVTFAEITQRAVRDAFKRPRDIDQNLVDAQQARRILDRVVGYKLSPLLWKKIIKRLSAGRVQSVAVRLACEREDEIEAFVPVEYWRIMADLAAPSNGRKIAFEAELKGRRRERRAKEACPVCGGPVKETTTPRGRILRCQKGSECRGSLGLADDGRVVIEDVPLGSEAEAAAALEEIKRHLFEVSEVARRESRGNPAPPFITSTLQQAAATRLSFTAKKTMMLAQRLYEGVELGPVGAVGLITYMRTDSVHLAPEAIGQARKYIKARYGDDYLPEKANAYRSRKGAQEAHEAVRPTQADLTPESVERYLEPDMLKLYRLVWQRFIACQMTPARYEDTSATILAGDYVFPAHGRVVIFPGCTAVYGPVQKASDKDRQERILPPMEAGQAVDCRSVTPSRHFTQPPPRYTEASLVKTLEAEGIGRPSTYASIISTIQDRGYVRKEGSSFHATELGRIVTRKLVDYFPSVMDVGFTADMENRLDEIEEGKHEWAHLLKDFYGPFERDLERAEKEMPAELDKPLPGGEACPECGKPLIKKLSRRGKFAGCSSFPDCRYSQPLDFAGNLVAVPPAAKGMRCPKCGLAMVMRVSKRGRFMACPGWPQCRMMIPLDEEGRPVELEQTNEVCEKCGSPMQVRLGRWGKFLACSGYPKCRNSKRMAGQLPGYPAPGTKPCEICGAEMVFRPTKTGGYLLCSKYPDCGHRRRADELDEVPPELRPAGYEPRTPEEGDPGEADDDAPPEE